MRTCEFTIQLELEREKSKKSFENQNAFQQYESDERRKSDRRNDRGANHALATFEIDGAGQQEHQLRVREIGQT